MSKTPLVIINSPTATGKTALGIKLAMEFGGEIISADSMQVYRYMDIGTAKPAREQRNQVRHHLIDIVDPDEEFNAALYADMTRDVIYRLAQAQKPVFIVGGTGLYIRALLKGIIETPQVDKKIRDHYKEMGEIHGRGYLFALLKNKDPQAASRIKLNDIVRVVRALEVVEQTGESITSRQARHAFKDSEYNCLKIGLSIEREKLKQQVEQRTKKMMDMGLIAEVKALLERGYSKDIKPMKSIGYKQITEYLEGEYDLEEAVRRINRDTWQYAKRQMTWFAADKEIQWFVPESYNDIRTQAENFLRENGLY